MASTAASRPFVLLYTSDGLGLLLSLAYLKSMNDHNEDLACSHLPLPHGAANTIFWAENV